MSTLQFIMFAMVVVLLGACAYSLEKIREAVETLVALEKKRWFGDN